MSSVHNSGANVSTTLIDKSKEKAWSILRKRLSKNGGDGELVPNINTEIVGDIQFILSKTAPERNKQTMIQAKQAILTVCTFSQFGTMINLDKIREVIGITKMGSMHKN